MHRNIGWISLVIALACVFHVWPVAAQSPLNKLDRVQQAATDVDPRILGLEIVKIDIVDHGGKMSWYAQVHNHGKTIPRGNLVISGDLIEGRAFLGKAGEAIEYNKSSTQSKNQIISLTEKELKTICLFSIISKMNPVKKEIFSKKKQFLHIFQRYSMLFFESFYYRLQGERSFGQSYPSGSNSKGGVRHEQTTSVGRIAVRGAIHLCL